ncbi:hypothetical protein ACJX0J_039473, partial [Zea mays]
LSAKEVNYIDLYLSITLLLFLYNLNDVYCDVDLDIEEILNESKEVFATERLTQNWLIQTQHFFFATLKTLGLSLDAIVLVQADKQSKTPLFSHDSKGLTEITVELCEYIIAFLFSINLLEEILMGY